MNTTTDSTELNAWIRLSLEPGLSPAKVHGLLSVFGLPQNIYAAATGSLAAYVDPLIASRMRQPASPELQTTIEHTSQWLLGKDCRIITLADQLYPKGLLDLSDAPLLLYAKGQITSLQKPAIGIVGARSCTPQGGDNAVAFARFMASHNWCVISGLAKGIDAAAHTGALAASTKDCTIAVLGSGIDTIYPRANTNLAEQISDNGLLISEFPLGMPALPGNFPRRNRLVAALSQGILVVEAAIRSGSLITARLAGELGREVYAIPGSIHSPLARGCHRLIRQGAKLVESGQDILEELQPKQLADIPTSCQPALSMAPGPSAGQQTHDNAYGSPDKQPQEQPRNEAAILLQAIGYDPADTDLLQKRTGWDTDKLMNQLTLLEIDGYIVRLENGSYMAQKI